MTGKWPRTVKKQAVFTPLPDGVGHKDREDEMSEKRDYGKGREAVGGNVVRIHTSLADKFPPELKEELSPSPSQEEAEHKPGPFDEATTVPYEEVKTIGGFYPTTQTLLALREAEVASASEEDTVDPTAKTIATPVPPPVTTEEARTETGSYEVPLEDDSSEIEDAPASAEPVINQEEIGTQDMPVVTEEDVSEPKKLGVLEPKHPPPFRVDRLSDPGSEPPPSPPQAPPRPPRHEHKLAVLPVITPEHVARAEQQKLDRMRMEWITEWEKTHLPQIRKQCETEYKEKLRLKRNVLLSRVAKVSFVGLLLAGVTATLVAIVLSHASRTPDHEAPTAPVTDPTPPPEPEAREDLAPPPPPAPNFPSTPPSPVANEPGLAVSGQPSGASVRVPMRRAFPRTCATLGSAHLPGVDIVCARNARRGDDYCNCEAVGLVP